MTYQDALQTGIDALLARLDEYPGPDINHRQWILAAANELQTHLDDVLIESDGTPT